MRVPRSCRYEFHSSVGLPCQTTKPPILNLCFVFHMYRCFGPGPFVPTLSNPPLDPLPAPFLDSTPSSFEPGIFSTLQQLRNLFSPGTLKSYLWVFVLPTWFLGATQNRRASPGNFAVKFVIFPVIGYSMFQHLTCLPYYSVQHVQHLFLRPVLVFLKVWKLFFFLAIFLTSNRFNVHA